MPYLSLAYGGKGEPMENTPRLYCELVALLGQPRQWRDRRHLQTFIWMMVGLIHSGCVSLTAWVPFVTSRARYAQSTQRRFARWLQNQRIEVHTLYAPLIQTALADWGNHTLYLALDTTLLWNHYCIGIKAIFGVSRPGRPSCKVEDFHLAPGRAIFLHHVRITAEHYGPVSLALARHTSNGECWYVVSDEPTSVHTFVEYSWRFDIEENFLDDKSNGFQLESSLVRTAEAVARLCLVLAVTPLDLVAQGPQVVAGLQRG